MLQSVGSQANPSIKVITSAHIKDVHTQEQFKAVLAEHGSNSKFCETSFKILRHRGIDVPEEHALTDAERASILARMTTEPMAGHG